MFKTVSGRCAFGARAVIVAKCEQQCFRVIRESRGMALRSSGLTWPLAAVLTLLGVLLAQPQHGVGSRAPGECN